jgi:hypothetical protein
MSPVKAIALMAMTACVLTVTAVSSRADDRDRETTWKTIKGITQANNVVDGITGGGQPWSTLSGEASVDLRRGEIEFEVRGLVLAGGDTIGTPGAVTAVAATIVCGAGVSVSTAPIPLSAQGDAHFEGDIVVPPACTSTNVNFLLTAGPRWIANGSVRRP